MKLEPRPPAITAGTVPIAIATESRCSWVRIARCRAAWTKPRMRTTTSTRK